MIISFREKRQRIRGLSQPEAVKVTIERILASKRAVLAARARAEKSGFIPESCKYAYEFARDCDELIDLIEKFLGENAASRDLIVLEISNPT